MSDAMVAHGFVIGAFTKKHFAEYMLKKLLNEETSYKVEDFVIVYRKDKEFEYELVCINYRSPLTETAFKVV